MIFLLELSLPKDIINFSRKLTIVAKSLIPKPWGGIYHILAATSDPVNIITA